MSKMILNPATIDGLPQVTCQDVHTNLGALLKAPAQLIDVRGPDEFNGELGHIEGAQLVTLGAELSKFLDSGDRNKEYVFICKAGGRSARATAEALSKGYKHAINMMGGMMKWNDHKLPVKRA